MLIIICFTAVFLLSADSYVIITSGAYLKLTSSGDDKSYLVNGGVEDGQVIVNNGGTLTYWSSEALSDFTVTDENPSAQNNYISFDGSDDYISISDHSTLDLSASMTIEFWVYTTSNTEAYQWVICKSVGDDNENFRIGFSPYNNNIYFDYGDGNQNTQTTSFTIDTDTWYHMAFSVSAGNTAKIYVNGMEATSYEPNPNATAPNPIPTNDSNLEIGRYSNYTKLTGRLDELRIWNDIRTESEIRQNMYHELPNPTSETNLASYYQLNSDLSDISSNSNNGTFYGGSVSYTPSPAFFGPKKCLDFDGTDDYVNCSTINLSGSAVTLECWVNAYAFQSATPYISSIMGTESGGTALLRFGDAELAMNKVQFVIDIGGQTKLDGVTELTTDKWYHIAGVYDGSDMRIYINGKLDASKIQTGSITSNGAFCIASNTGSERFLDGSIDEVRVWSDARTASEIRENMCKNLTGNEAGLVAYYTCDNTSGTKLQNIKSTSYDGTLNGGMGNSNWTTSSAFNTWLSTSSSSWSSATNWSRGSDPASSDNVGIYSYTDGTDAILSDSPEVNNFLFGSSSSITLSSGFTVNGNLILESNLDLNGQTITLGSSATLLEDSGKLSGSTGTITTTRDIGTPSSDNIAGLGAELTSSTIMGSTTVTRGHTQQTGAGGTGINRYYDITPTTNTGLNATLVFHYNDDDISGYSESALSLWKSENPYSAWTEMGGTVSEANNTVTLSGIDSFSRWTATDSDNSLPVTLSSFTGSLENGFPILNWITESELENLGWNIYRSKSENGLENNSLQLNDQLIPGMGTVSIPTDYSYIDEEPIEETGLHYYWLESVSYSGELEIYGPVSIDLSNSVLIPEIPLRSYINKNYPNPFNPVTTIKFGVKEGEIGKFSIYNILGQKVLSKKFEAGFHTFTWDASKQASGVYFYQLRTPSYYKTKKMIMLK